VQCSGQERREREVGGFLGLGFSSHFLDVREGRMGFPLHGLFSSLCVPVDIETPLSLQKTYLPFHDEHPRSFVSSLSLILRGWL
jgi:hypothetical protein